MRPLLPCRPKPGGSFQIRSESQRMPIRTRIAASVTSTRSRSSTGAIVLVGASLAPPGW